MERLMKIISAIFHPLLIATYSCLLLWWIFPAFFSPIPPASIGYLVLAVFTTTFMVPVFSILLMLQAKRISNLELSVRQDRLLPFLMIGGFYALTTYLFYMRLRLAPGLIYLMAEVTLLIFVITIISMWFKISVHAAAIWGFCGIWTVIAIRYLPFEGKLVLMTVFPIAGITTASRLYLNRHTPVEAWAGSILGLVSGFLGTYFLL